MLAKTRMIAGSHARIGAPIVSALAILAVLVMAPSAASARSNGIATGGSGCSCHGGASGAVTVTITGSSTLAALGTGTYTATISGTTLVGAALDVAATAGSTTAGSLTATAAGTGIDSGDVVHTQRNDTIFAYNFDVTAPAALGTFDLLAAMLGYNGAGGSNGDNWNTTTFQITVVPEPATALMLGLSLVGLAVVGRRRRA
jgi:hypothetical protein